MKTRTLLLLSLLGLLLMHPAAAQQDKGAFLGLHHRLSLRQLTTRCSISPMAGYQINRHQFAAGPVLLSRDFPSTNSGWSMLNGLFINYRYQISNNPKVKWHATITSIGQNFREEWHSNYWESSRQAYVDDRQESQELLWENYAGAALQYPVHNRIGLTASAELGYALSSLRRNGESIEEADNTFDYRGYDNREFVYAISLGMYLQLWPKP